MTETTQPNQVPASKIITEDGTPATLAGALALFQSSLPEIPRTKTGQDGHRTFMYADITAITRACAPELSKLGLSISSATQIRDGRTILVTKLMHVSGEYETAELDVTAPAGNMKILGANITYGRRYAYGALTGIVTDEDQDAQGTEVIEAPQPTEPVDGAATKEQLKQLYEAGGLGIPVDDIMRDTLGRDANPGNLTSEQAAKLIKAVNSYQS